MTRDDARGCPEIRYVLPLGRPLPANLRWASANMVRDACAYHHGYLTSRRAFITYDDPESIAIKARYGSAAGLAGLMFWEASEDSASVLLLRAIEAWNEGSVLPPATLPPRPKQQPQPRRRAPRRRPPRRAAGTERAPRTGAKTHTPTARGAEVGADRLPGRLRHWGRSR